MDLEEFEEAQKYFQHSFATYKEVYGAKDKTTMRAHLGVVTAARLAGNLQHAKEILETADDILSGIKLNLYTSVLSRLSVGC